MVLHQSVAGAQHGVAPACAGCQGSRQVDGHTIGRAGVAPMARETQQCSLDCTRTMLTLK
eukprot:1054444-Pelagomonas_calceolata.AAC.2